MTYVKESLKFMLFSFFKRCRLIISILIQYKESRNYSSHEQSRRRRGKHSSGSKTTRESIIADMLAQNFKWAFLTILTCIEKSEAYQKEQQD